MRADAVFAWNELLLQLAPRMGEMNSPIVEARVFAMTHLAMDEAVRACPAIPPERRQQAHRAAAICAARDVLTALLPDAKQSVDAMAKEQLEGIPDDEEKRQGREAGRVAAERWLRWRAGDQWMELAGFNSAATPPPEGFEAATERLARGETLPKSPWLAAVPFGMKSVKQFEVREVRTFNRAGASWIDSGIVHSQLFDRVDREGAQQVAGECWSQHPIPTWNRIARQLAANRALDVAQEARMLATLNATLADATISCVHWRYTVGQWRSLSSEEWELVEYGVPRSTDIFVQVGDGSRPAYARLEPRHVLIPPTPHYPSPAATLAGAAQKALTSFFETDRMEFALPDFSNGIGKQPGRAPVIRTFSTISAAARECAYVATLNGSHSRESCVAGYLLGESIGGYVSKRTLVAKR